MINTQLTQNLATRLLLTRVLAVASLAVGFTIGPVLHAQSLKLDKDFLIPPVATNKIQMRENSNIQSTIEFEHFSFISANESYFGRDINAASLSAMGLGLKNNSEKLRLDAHWLFVPQEKEQYFNIPEVSYASHTQTYDMHVGRHLTLWSQADEFWQMGMWQPQFSWDLMHPAQQGLTGLFFQTKSSSNWNLLIFTSAVNVPSQSPKYEEVDGKVVSKNAWFHSPPPSANIFGQATEVKTNVEEPSLADVVFQPSIAFQLQKKWSDKTASRLSYAYKPINQPHLSYEYVLRSHDSTSEADVTVHPDFPYAHVVNFETEVAFNVWRITPSFSYENILMRDFPPEQISQNLADSTMASLVVSHLIDVNSPARGRVYGGVMRLWSKLLADQGENSQSGISQFDLRLPYYQAVRLGAERSFSTGRQKAIRTNIEMTYDMLQEGALFLSKINYSWDKAWDIGFRFNLIGATTTAVNEYDKGFLRGFRANDNVGVDINYVY